MNCPNCGKALADGSRFCTKCGTKIEVQVEDNKMESTSEIAEKSPVIEIDDILTKQPSSENNQKKPFVWKEQYTYISIAACVVLAAIIGLAVKMSRSPEPSSDLSSYDQNQEEALATTADVFNGESFENSENEQTEVGEVEAEEDYYAMAQEAFLSEDYEQAFSYCRMALQDDPQREDVYLLAAKILLTLNYPDSAMMLLEQGVDVCSETDQLVAKMNELWDSVQPVECEVYNSLGELLGVYGYENGQQLEYTSYNGGTENAHEYFSYDNQGNMVTLDHYENGQLMFKEYYSYNGMGARTSTTHYNSNSKVDWMEEYDNDSQGRVTAVYHYSSGKNLAWWDEYVYGANGHFQKLAHPKEGSTVVFNCLYEYDENGNETKYVEEDTDGNITYMWEKEYDVFNNMTLYSYGDSQQNYVYTYMQM